MNRGRLPPAMRYWFTLEERSYDHRTGASARIKERARREGDRPGKHDTVWGWAVVAPGQTTRFDVAQTQHGARAAVRKYVRALPEGSPIRVPRTQGDEK